MKRILVFGAGKSSTFLIDYLSKLLRSNNWFLVVADADLSAAEKKVQGIPNSEALAIDVTNDEHRKHLIQTADIVISLLPPTLHYLIATDCISTRKNLLTASYIDDRIKALSKEIEDNQLLFLCEMGLGPGI